MAKRKFIEITLGNYSILHGYDENNQEIRENITVNSPKKTLLATDTILSVDDEYITTSQIKNKLHFWEYSESFIDIQLELCSQKVHAY